MRTTFVGLSLVIAGASSAAPPVVNVQDRMTPNTAIPAVPIDATRSVGGGAAGRSTAEVEQTLTLLHASAARLAAELERLGTSPAEQEVTFFGSSEGGTSLSDFVAWVSKISAPFAGTGAAQPVLKADTAQSLASELEALADKAEDASGRAARSSADPRATTARQRFADLALLLRRARDQSQALVRPIPRRR